MGRPKKPVVPLTAEQQKIAESYMLYVSKIAYRLWQWSRLPARYLEDIKAESHLGMCIGIIRYKPEGKYTLKTMVFLNVKRHIFDLINNCRGFSHLAGDIFDKELSSILEDYPIEEHPQTDLLVSALHFLSEQERQVIGHRYGLEGSYPKSVMETSRLLKVGHCVVIRNERRGLDCIRNFMESNHATS